MTKRFCEYRKKETPEHRVRFCKYCKAIYHREWQRKRKEKLAKEGLETNEKHE